VVVFPWWLSSKGCLKVTHHSWYWILGFPLRKMSTLSK
jgi:hypothetical protein